MIHLIWRSSKVEDAIIINSFAASVILVRLFLQKYLDFCLFDNYLGINLRFPEDLAATLSEKLNISYLQMADSFIKNRTSYVVSKTFLSKVI